MTRILRAALTEGPLSLHEHEELVANEAAGAVVGFAGVVRNHDGGREVVRLEYSAHPLAEETLFEVLAEVAGSCTGVRAGGQPPHRQAAHRRRRPGGRGRGGPPGAAFETCARLVDTIKERLPVWKHQFFADGSDEWVNSA